ncbi:Histidine-containing phosphotransfer (HPt) domain profile [Nakaseomyces glabratus]|nr:Histidine-containing phosphotransfer (HPt) domain profile [Nakaseomyces glabratus]KAH7584543.1 Histidine-containing phosphotransfer (HPt) domain profile [Nakaseomyces glabratus]KAI8394576.1 Histidine-containing phosphotransfer (HPt) domain profile [Nakaseomyces glabratus]OXB41516.1 hypothetical protein B1J91_K04961g [Nakaseomyces glabratus]OXB46816.1 hypothetical protein B1J92_K04961g [Nakaseomyces glabratus]
MTTVPSEIIDWTILNEIVSMDEDDPDFSKGLIIQYIDQATTTFSEMDNLLGSIDNLKELDNLGHFLKGSSAALGLQRIAWACERIQNLGRKAEDSFPERADILKNLPDKVSVDEEDKKEENEEVPQDDKKYLYLIKKALAQARIEFKLARRELSDYYKTEL